MAAVRASGRRLAGVFAPQADGAVACAGQTVQPAAALAMHPGLWVVSACASPGDVTALYEWVPMDRCVHVAEPASIRPAAPPFASHPALEGLGHARARRAAKAFDEAEVAYRALLRDPRFADAGAARYELALVHEALGRTREAEAGLRWALRHWTAERALAAYTLGSFYERQARWALAVRAFTRALSLTAAHDLARVGGCQFHLGELALAQGDDAGAREHYAQALAAVPDHGKARLRLEALVTAWP